MNRTFIGAVALCLLLTPGWSPAKEPRFQKGFHDTFRRPGQDEPGKQKTPEQIRAMNKARTELKAAETALERVRKRLDAEFKLSPAWMEAQSAIEQAQETLEAVRTPILKQVRESSAYASALSKKKQADEKRESLKQNKDASADDKTVAINAFLQASAAVTKLETDALNADSAVLAAREELRLAMSKSEDLKEQFTSELPTHPDWLAAKQEVEVRREALIAAEKA